MSLWDLKQKISASAFPNMKSCLNIRINIICDISRKIFVSVKTNTKNC